MRCVFLMDTGQRLCKPKRAGECGRGQESANRIEISERDQIRIKHWPGGKITQPSGPRQ